MTDRLFKGIFLCFFFILTTLVSCKRNDDEPLLPPTRISRLYVSFLEVQPDDLALPFDNIGVFEPADSLLFPLPKLFNSQVKEGGGIYFNPYAKRVFQGSLKDFSIKTFSVSLIGVLGTASSFIDSTLVSQAGLAFDQPSTYLYVSNNLTNSIHAYKSAANINGVLKKAPKRFILNSQPRGLVLDHDSIMVVLRSEAVHQVGLLENPSKIDSGQVTLSKVITISGASDLRGIAYSSKLNLLVLSDVGNGKVYIVENAREAFSQSSVITSEQTISGELTQISQPIDVAIDDREGKMFLYVADRSKKSILRFKLTDRGNIAPGAVVKTTLTPVSIYLDAR